MRDNSNVFEVVGKYNRAVIFAENVDPGAVQQIQVLCDQEFIKESKIRIMPDVHKGIGCTIGTTMTIDNKVVPNLVGVDIGCGVEVLELGTRSIDPERLDRLIYEKIPSGFNVRKKEHDYNEYIDLNELKCKNEVNLSRARLSIGTLGGGNHFIEVNRDSRDNLYIVVHSGSRHLGHEVATLYQKKAYMSLDKDKKAIIPRELAYVSGELFNDYIHDMKIVQRFAELNRKAMIGEIVQGMDISFTNQFTTIHNYIDTDNMILRKGAVSAQKGEKLLIPINMCDGSLICIGKGNSDWNFSAPHGAGRIMSRRQAKRSFTLNQFKETMEGIFTTSLNRGTIDECPLAYKPISEIKDSIGSTVEIIDTIKPIYNFKAVG
jgi:tRNA-splicing ligase RtcB